MNFVKLLTGSILIFGAFTSKAQAQTAVNILDCKVEFSQRGTLHPGRAEIRAPMAGSSHVKILLDGSTGWFDYYLNTSPKIQALLGANKLKETDGASTTFDPVGEGGVTYKFSYSSETSLSILDGDKTLLHDCRSRNMQ